MTDNTICPICHRGADHKMGCPNRPGYADRVILSTNLPKGDR